MPDSKASHLSDFHAWTCNATPIADLCCPERPPKTCPVCNGPAFYACKHIISHAPLTSNKSMHVMRRETWYVQSHVTLAVLALLQSTACSSGSYRRLDCRASCQWSCCSSGHFRSS